MKPVEYSSPGGECLHATSQSLTAREMTNQVIAILEERIGPVDYKPTETPEAERAIKSGIPSVHGLLAQESKTLYHVKETDNHATDHGKGVEYGFNSTHITEEADAPEGVLADILKSLR